MQTDDLAAQMVREIAQAIRLGHDPVVIARRYMEKATDEAAARIEALSAEVAWREDERLNLLRANIGLANQISTRAVHDEFRRIHEIEGRQFSVGSATPTDAQVSAAVTAFEKAMDGQYRPPRYAIYSALKAAIRAERAGKEPPHER